MRNCFEPEEETIAELLKASGYKQAWLANGIWDKLPFLPLNYGFDEYLGLPFSHDYWPVNYDGKATFDTTTQRQMAY